MRKLATLLVVVVAACGPGEDTIATVESAVSGNPFPGASYARHAGGGRVWHVVRVDLSHPNLRVRASRSEERGLTTQQFAERAGAAVAVKRRLLRLGLRAAGAQHRPRRAVARHDGSAGPHVPRV